MFWWEDLIKFGYQVGVGLIGYGFGGRVFHAPVIASVPGLALRGIVERSTQYATRDFPSVRVFRSHEELIAQPDVDLVVVSTPNPTHFEIAMLALESGKHVVIDKPMAVSSGQAAALEARALQRQLILSPYHNRRWDGDFRTVAGILDQGLLGKPIRYESYFDRYRPQLRPGAWRERREPGSGFLFDLGSHLLDQAFALFGLPHSIFAEVRCERAGAVVDDAFDLHLGYDGLSVRLGASALRKDPRPRFFVQGSAASFTKYGYDPQSDLLERGKRPGGPRWGVERRKEWGELQEYAYSGAARKIKTEPGDYRGYYENVRDAILGKAELKVTAADGRNTIRAIELAVESNLSKSVIAWDLP